MGRQAPCRPGKGRQGYSFEILIFLKYKNEKNPCQVKPNIFFHGTFTLLAQYVTLANFTSRHSLSQKKISKKKWTQQSAAIHKLVVGASPTAKNNPCKPLEELCKFHQIAEPTNQNGDVSCCSFTPMPPPRVGCRD